MQRAAKYTHHSTQLGIHSHGEEKFFRLYLLFSASFLHFFLSFFFFGKRLIICSICISIMVQRFDLLINMHREFPGGPVGKTLLSQCRGPGFDPGLGN